MNFVFNSFFIDIVLKQKSKISHETPLPPPQKKPGKIAYFFHPGFCPLKLKTHLYSWCTLVTGHRCLDDLLIYEIGY